MQKVPGVARGARAERGRFPVPARVSALFPVLAVLVGLILLGYPLALIFGLPLALRDMRDLRKWDKARVTAQPPQELGGTDALTFGNAPENGVLVRDGAPLALPYAVSGDTVTFEAEPSIPLVTWGGRSSPPLRRSLRPSTLTAASYPTR